ncbi:site-specific DNA-methyltransferase [Deinococcus aestuarii]|uniref:site-specific DNA-methyltransferase n=1 Tax=Deinococcus aestuarii TaxID=2774531 RepID=UPI001C0DAD26|nr:site-specific DNA-methyltransferase [Deinococcus aestuarii]
MQKILPRDPETASLDGLSLNVERLRELFPEAFNEGNLNFEVLRELLGAQLDQRPEKYGLNWHGKSAARRHALTPTRATLRPDSTGSVDWDNTQNLMIEGDNLEVLKLLQRGYAGKVKLIYIDPPYNTGKDFVYPDDYTDSIANYQALTGQVEEGRRVSSNVESSGRFHTDWLNMMYPRLKLARELLRDDGAIFISIDDAEFANLRRVCDEIFGEENFLGSFVWRRRASSAMADRNISTDHEYIVAFQRGDFFSIGIEKDFASYSNPDNDPRGPWVAGDLTVGMGKDLRPNQFYILTDPETGKSYQPNPNRVWAYIPESMDRLIQEKRILFPADTTKRPMLKRFASELKSDRNPLSTWMTDVGMNTDATREMQLLMPEGGFDYPKSTSLLTHLIKTSSADQDLILDFFAGSGTTGHAVLKQNAIDGAKRRYILVQFPELLDAGKPGQKTAADFCDSLGVPRTLAELTKERLRRAGAKIKAENPMFAGDTGFRVFKLDSSNLNEWDPAAAQVDLEGTLLKAVENVKPGRTQQDVLFELLLKLGLELTTPLETRVIAGKQVHSVGAGALMVCLEYGIDGSNYRELGQEIADWAEQQDAVGGTQLVFLDSGFADDMAKTNLSALLEQRAKGLKKNWIVRSI